MKKHENRKLSFLKQWCPACHTEVGNTCRMNGKSLSKCPHFSDISSRAVVYKPGSNERRVKTITGKDYAEIVKEALSFYDEVKNGSNQCNTPEAEVKNNHRESKPELTVAQAMTLYISYLEGKRGPKHMINGAKSKEHIHDVETGLVLFSQAMKLNGINPQEISIERVNQEMVGFYHSYLLEVKKYSDYSYDRHMSHFHGLYSYLNKYEGYNLPNPFGTVKKRRTAPEENITIEPEEFKKLLTVITPENGVQILSSGEKKYHYHPFIKPVFMAAMLMGLRREQLVSVRYSDIEEGENKIPLLIHSDNLKVNRLLGINEKEKKRITPVPVTEQLRKLLEEVYGYSENRHTDKFIIAGESNLDRKHLAQILSRSFANFWKQTNIQRDISFKVFRKSYCTKMFSALGDSANAVTGHSSSHQNTLLRHYVNRVKIARQVAGNTEIFKDMDEVLDSVIEETRSRELEMVRTERKQKNISLER